MVTAEFSWKSMDFTGCKELKSKDYKSFVSAQNQTLRKLVGDGIGKGLSH
jgi:hypothetical protein